MDPSPRRWWRGPLDVEQLAWDSATRLVDAAGAVAAVRGLDVVVDTTAELVAGAFAAMDHLRMDGLAPSPWAELSGFFAARDGWVRLHANYPHHEAALRTVLGVSDRPSLEREVGRHDALELEQRITEAGGVAGAVRAEARWNEHPHALATASTPWARVVDRGPRPPQPLIVSGRDERPDRGVASHRRSRPEVSVSPGAGVRTVESRAVRAPGHAPAAILAGVRVLDLTRVIAGPSCSQVLACLGADVVRIDPPHLPEILAQYQSTGMGKRSAVVDLRQDGSRWSALAASADVVLSGYRPGVLDRFGLGAEELAASASGLVIAQLSAWGDEGPWGNRAGFDSIVQAVTGIAVRYGSADQPGALPVQALDHATGLQMAALVLEALADARARTIRISLLGASRTLLDAPPPPDRPPASLDVPSHAVRYGGIWLDAVPPPLRIDGSPIGLPIGVYGAAEAAWR